MKKNTRKFIFGASTLGLIASPIAAMISCSSESGKDVMVTNIVKKDKSDVNFDGDFKDASITVVTDAGKVSDLSFNQSAWEAATTFGNQFSKDKNYIEPKAPAVIDQAYTQALSNMPKVLVLPGFTHIGKWSNHSMPEGKAIAVIIDGAVDKNKNTIGLQYRVEQSAFLAGYGTAKWLVDVKGDTDPKVGVWSGANAEGVVNYAIGYLAGVVQWNKNNPNKTVKFAGNSLTLNTGFSAGGGQTVASTLTQKGADVLLAIAGPQTADALKVAKKDVKVIGVDVNQSVAYPDDADKFLTSIEKNIGQSTYDNLIDIFSNDKSNFGKVVYGGLDKKWSGISKSNVKNAIPTFEDLSKSTNDIYKIAKKIELQSGYNDKSVATFTGQSENILNINDLTSENWKTLGITTVTT